MFGSVLELKFQVTARALKYLVAATSCLKRSTINSEVIVRKVLRFNWATAPSLAAGLRSGLIGYATNITKTELPATLWLRTCDGQTFRIGVEMHDQSDWEEIGTLKFQGGNLMDFPEMVNLPASWSKVNDVQKLVLKSDEYEAECGFLLFASDGEKLVVLPGADIYTLAIKAPFYSGLFKPESDLAAYICEAF